MPLAEIIFKFCCQSYDVISRQNPLKLENKNHTVFWNTKLCHPAKVVPKWPFHAFGFRGVV